MRLGTKLGTVLGSALTARSTVDYESIILALEPHSWFRADSYESSGGKVTGFVDRITGTHALSQSTDSARASDPATDGAANNQLAATLSTTHWYRSTDTAASWNFGHNGTGMTFVINYTPTGDTANEFILSTASAQAAPGMWLIERSTTLAFAVSRGATGLSISEVAAQNPRTSGSPLSVVMSHGSSATPDYATYCNDVAGASGNYAQAVSTGDCLQLVLGASSAGTAGASFRFYDLLTFDRVLTTEELAQLSAYRLDRYGY